MKVAWSLMLGLFLALLTASASYAQTTGYVVPKCTGDPRKDTPALKDAFARGGTIYLPACEYWVSDTLILKSGTRVIGAGYPSSVLFSVITNGKPTIASSSGSALNNVYLADFQIKGKYGMGIKGLGDGLLLYGVTNSTFERLKVANFRNNAFTIKKPSGSSVGISNSHFDSIFVISTGGYGFDVDGTAGGSWNMIDVNSPSTGAYRFRAGSSGAPRIEITGFIAEWHKTYASRDHMILFDAPNGQSIRFRGCACSAFHQSSPANLSFIRANGTVKVEFLGCTGGTGDGTKFKNWISSPSRTVAYMERINKVY